MRGYNLLEDRYMVTLRTNRTFPIKYLSCSTKLLLFLRKKKSKTKEVEVDGWTEKASQVTYAIPEHRQVYANIHGSDSV